VPDLVDFTSAFPDDAANEIIRDKDLLRLELVLLRGVVLRRGRRRWGRVVHVEIRIPRNVGGRHPRGSACIARRPVARMCERRRPFVCFNEYIPDVIRRDVDGVRDTRDAQDSLPNREISTRKIKIRIRQPLSSLATCPHLRSAAHHLHLEFP
jgi:hypothetical protein